MQIECIKADLHLTENTYDSDFKNIVWENNIASELESDSESGNKVLSI